MSLTVAKLNRVGFSGGGCDVVVANNRKRRGDRCVRDRAKAPGGVSRGAAQRSRRQHRRARGGFAGQRNCRVVPRRRPDVDGRPRHSPNWAFRATADAMFDGVHLDVEPWPLPRWPTATGPRASSPTFAGLRSCVWRRGGGTESAWRHSRRRHRYRQHDIRRRRRGCAAPGARRGRHTNRRAPVRRVRSSSPRLLADDAPVTAYSRPADTQLMSWNRFPDTAVAAVSSALS